MNYKIKIYKYNVLANLTDDFPKVVSYFAAHNVNVLLDIEDTQIEKGDAPLKLMFPNDGKYDVVMYLYDRGRFLNMGYNGTTFQLSPTLRGVYLATSIVDDKVDYSWKSISHEIMHSLFFKFTGQGGNIPMDKTLVNGVLQPYYKNEDITSEGTGALDGNFAQAWKILNSYIANGQYKYFKLTESTGGGHTVSELKPELVALLDKARDIAGIQIKITSGFRSPAENAVVGGVQDSSHETGLAVDITIPDSATGGKILLALVQVGFKRFGFYQDGHLHVDIDAGKITPCFWVK